MSDDYVPLRERKWFIEHEDKYSEYSKDELIEEIKKWKAEALMYREHTPGRDECQIFLMETIKKYVEKNGEMFRALVKEGIYTKRE